MIFLYNKIYGSNNLDYIFANKQSWSFVVDGVSISTQPTRTDAIGYKQVYFTNKAVNWLVDTFGENVESPMLFYSLTGLIYSLDSENRERVLRLAKQQASKCKVLVLYDLNTDGEDTDYAEIYHAFCEFNLAENVFMWSKLKEDTAEQDRLRAILAETRDVFLNIKNTTLEVEVGQSIDLEIETNAKFTIESSANDILEVDFNKDKLDLEQQSPFEATNTTINALAEGEATIKVVAKNAVAKAEASITLKAIIVVPPNPLELRVEQLEQRMDAVEAEIAQMKTNFEAEILALKQKDVEHDKSILAMSTGIMDGNTLMQKANQTATKNTKSITALEAKVTANETKIAEIEPKVNENVAKIAQNDSNITNLTQEIADIKAQLP